MDNKQGKELVTYPVITVINLTFVDIILLHFNKKYHRLHNSTKFMQYFYHDLQKVMLHINEYLNASSLNNLYIIIGWYAQLDDLSRNITKAIGYLSDDGRTQFVSGLAAAIFYNSTDKFKQYKFTHSTYFRYNEPKQTNSRITQLVESFKYDIDARIIPKSNDYVVNQCIVDNIMDATSIGTSPSLSNASCLNYQYIYECLHEHINYICYTINNINSIHQPKTIQDCYKFNPVLNKKFFSILVYIENHVRATENSILFDTPIHRCILNCVKIITELLGIKDESTIAYAVYECFYEKNAYWNDFKQKFQIEHDLLNAK